MGISTTLSNAMSGVFCLSCGRQSNYKRDQAHKRMSEHHIKGMRHVIP